MAKPSFSALAQDDLSSPVCFELLRDPNTPKELNCSHVCCALCIQKMIEGGRLTVDCPECRNISRIPKVGVTAMKTNFRLRSLAEKHEVYMTKRKTKSSTKHKDDLKGANQEIKGATNLCLKYNIIIDFFCRKCLVGGCSTCMMNEHKGTGHETRNITTVHREQKDQLKIIFYQMDDEIQECMKGIILNLNTLQESMEGSLGKQQKQIRKHLEIVIKKVKGDAQRIQQQLDSIEQPKIDRVRKERKCLQSHMKEIEDLKSSAQSSIDTYPKHEHVEQHAAIAESVFCKLGKDCKAPKDLNHVFGRARFQAAN